MPVGHSLTLNLFFYFAVFSCTAFASDDIAMLRLDTGHTIAWRKYHAAVFHEFGVVDILRKHGGFEHWQSPPWFVLANRGGFQSQRAYTWRILKNGSVVRTGLLTVSGGDVFDKLVADDVALRDKEYGSEGKATVEGSRYKKTIRSPSRTYIDEDGIQVTSRRNDLHIAYSDGIMAMGAAKARPFEFPFKVAKRLLKPAEGKTTYLIYRPTVVPEELRGQFIAQVEKAMGVRLQQQDDESKANYSLRRVLAESYLDSLRSGVMDIDQIQVWTKWPRSSSDPFRGRVKLTINPKTRLATIVAKLRQSRPCRNVSSDGDVGYLNINLGLPTELRVLLRAYIASFFPRDGQLRQSLKKAIEDEALTASFRLRETADSHPLLVGAMRLLDTPSDLSALTDLFGESRVTTDGLFEGVTEWSVFEQSFDPRKFAIGAADKEIRFAMSSGESVPPFEQAEGLIEQGRVKSQPLIEVSVDLKPWMKRDADLPVRKLLEKLETVYLRYGSWSTHQRNAAKRRERSRQRGITFPNPPLVFKNYDSLIGRGNLDGDWTFKATLKATDSTVTIDWRVGRDLHSYYLTRSYVRWPAE